MKCLVRVSLFAVTFASACASHRALEGHARADNVTCLGPAEAKYFAVYLHGRDSTQPSTQELGNRAALAQVAQALSMRIALPRAAFHCPEGSATLCWGWALKENEMDAAARATNDAAAKCFGNDKPFGLIGFSSGGGVATKAFRNCQLQSRFSQAPWAVAIGSSMFKGPLGPESPPRLEGCGTLVLLTGEHDPSRDPAEHYLKVLREKGAHVTALSFDGAHEVTADSLQRALGEVLPK